MTLAASELNVTAGAVSRQVRDLERQLDRKLFVRSSSGLEATESGEVLAKSAREALEMLATATGQVRQHRSRTLRIGAYGYFLSRAVFPLLSRLGSELPDLEIEFYTSSNPLDLVPTAFDAVITVSESRSRAGVLAKPLMPIETVAVCAPALVAGSRPDFAALPLLHARPRPNDWRRWLDHAGFTSVPVVGGSTFESIGLAIEAAGQGLGAAIAIEALLPPDLDSNRVVIAHPTRRPTRHHFVLQIETKRKHDRDLNRFADWLEDKLAANLRSDGAPRP